MTPESFRATLQRLGLSQADFARINEMSKHTVSRWATGKVPIPRIVESWLEQREALQPVE